MINGERRMSNEHKSVQKGGNFRIRDIDRSVWCYTVYRNGTMVVRRDAVSNNAPVGGKRGVIKELSTKARARLMFVVNATSVEFRSMITLTYPREFPCDGAMVKSHLDDFIKSFKYRYAGDYLWFLEFQARGAPHFHFLHTRQNVFSADRRWLALRWADVIGLSEERRYCSLSDRRTHCMRMQCLRVNTHSKTWEEIRSELGARAYVNKYASKPYQKQVPDMYQNVGRFYGYSRNVYRSIKELDTFQAEAHEIRAMLKSEGHKVGEWEYLPKYIFGVKSVKDLTDEL